MGTPDEKDLRQEVKELQEANINLKFDSVEKQLSEIKTLLKESISKAELNHELAIKNIEDTKARVAVLEEKHRNCPIATYKGELKRFGIETKFLRYVFSNPWKGVLFLTLWVVLIVFILAVVGPDQVIKFVTLFK